MQATCPEPPGHKRNRARYGLCLRLSKKRVAHDAGGPAGGLWRPADIASALRQPRTLTERGHRPWAVPGRPWVMGQSWENLLFAHWRVGAEKIRSLMPVQIPLS